MNKFLLLPDVLGPDLNEPGTYLWFFDGTPAEKAGKMLGVLYWGGAMVGRFGGSLLLTRVKASRLLTFCALATTILSLIVSQTTGGVAAYACLAVGLFNSIMFPAIFTITLERSRASTASTSGLLCMAIIGGAILPQIVARMVDAHLFHAAYFVPMAAYLVVVLFAAKSSTAPIVSHGAAPAAGH